MTKDGNVLLNEMQIQHPTASLIARVATAQDDITGDGTTSNVLIIGELLKQADLYISEGLHPRIVADGFDIAREEAVRVLDSMKIAKDGGMDRDTLLAVARTSLRTKLHVKMADLLTESIVDGVQAIQQEGKPLDLFMVEMMTMQHKTSAETQYIPPTQHSARGPDCRAVLSLCCVLTTCTMARQCALPFFLGSSRAL